MRVGIAHVTRTAVSNGFVHIAVTAGSDTCRVICTKPDGAQMIFALSEDEARDLCNALKGSIQS